MPTSSRTSFKKRQKEAARAEKQREKTAKRLARKHDKDPSTGEGPPVDFDFGIEETGEPTEETGEPKNDQNVTG
jgi:hypothetical protein